MGLAALEVLKTPCPGHAFPGSHRGGTLGPPPHPAAYLHLGLDEAHFLLQRLVPPQ